MSLNQQKNELHQRLWAAQERWFALREQGVTKHDLKTAGLRERNDPWWACRGLIFTGNTRLTYERTLKGLLDFVHARGIERNDDITKREMRDYVHHLIDRGASQSMLDKVRSACVKMLALCPLHAYVYFPLDLDHRPKYPGGSSSGGAGCWPR